LELRARDVALAALLLALTWGLGLAIILSSERVAVILVRAVVAASLMLIGILAAASILEASKVGEAEEGGREAREGRR